MGNTSKYNLPKQVVKQLASTVLPALSPPVTESPSVTGNEKQQTVDSFGLNAVSPVPATTIQKPVTKTNESVKKTSPEILNQETPELKNNKNISQFIETKPAPKPAPKPALLTRQIQGLGGLLIFALNQVLAPLEYEEFQQMINKIFKYAVLSKEERAKIEYATTCIAPGIIFREMFNSIVDKVAELIIKTSKKYKLSQYSTPLALKIMELIKKHGGFNLQAKKEFYATATTICPGLTKTKEGETIANQAISMIVEVVDGLMGEAQKGIKRTNTQLTENDVENVLKICDRLIIQGKQHAALIVQATKPVIKEGAKLKAIC